MSAPKPKNLQFIGKKSTNQISKSISNLKSKFGIFKVISSLSIFAISLSLVNGAVITKAANLTLGTGSNSSCTQQDLQNSINSATSGDTINFNCGSNSTINFSSQITLNKNLIFDAINSPNLVFNGQGSTRFFIINASKIVTFKNLNFENGKVSGTTESNPETSGGGAIYADSRSELTLENTQFKNNIAGFGGAVLVKYHTKLNVINSTFDANQALVPNTSSERSGGAITVLTNGKTTVKGSTFINNISKGIGGAINSLLSGLIIEDSVFKNNTSEHVGGAIYTDGLDELTNDNLGGELIIRNSRFEGNIAKDDGGAGYLYMYLPDKLTLENNTFISNKAINGDGGALRLGQNNTTITNNSFIKNEAKNAGGIAIYNQGGDVNMKNMLFLENKASDNAGALLAFSNSPGKINIENATFAGNTAGGYNGAISNYGKSFSEITTKNSVYFGNTAGNQYNAGQTTAGNLSDGGNNYQFPNNYVNTTANGFKNATANITITNPLLTSFVDTGGYHQNTPCVTESTILNAGAGFICAPIPNKLPIINISTPNNNQNFNNPANFTISGSVSDTDGTIAKVEIFNGNTKLGDAVLSGNNWTYNVVNLGTGTHNLIAKTTDNQNGVKDAQVSVVVGTSSSLSVSNINPNQGAVAGGNTVTITGNGFNNLGNNGKYTMPLTVNNPNSTLYGYQIGQTVNTQSLIAAGKMKADCSDLRVRDNGGNDLPYWTDNKTCNTANTKIWFKASNLPNGNSNFKLTYGNPNWNSNSNPRDVFPFFDSFDGNGAVDSALWRDLTAPNGTTYTRENGELKIAGSGSGYGPIGIRPSMSFDPLLKNGGEFAIAATIRAVTVNSGALHPGSGVSSCLELRGGTNRDIGCFNNGLVVKGKSDFYNGTPFDWQDVELDYRGTANNRNVTYSENGADKATNTTNSDIIFAYNPLSGSAKNFDVRFDNIRVRQLAAQEVSSNVGTETQNQNFVVKIGNNDCTAVTITSNTELTCVIPAGSNGVVDVKLTNNLANETATLPQSYTYGSVSFSSISSSISQSLSSSNPSNSSLASSSVSSNSSSLASSSQTSSSQSVVSSSISSINSQSSAQNSSQNIISSSAISSSDSNNPIDPNPPILVSSSSNSSVLSSSSAISSSQMMNSSQASVSSSMQNSQVSASISASISNQSSSQMMANSSSINSSNSTNSSSNSMQNPTNPANSTSFDPDSIWNDSTKPSFLIQGNNIQMTPNKGETTVYATKDLSFRIANLQAAEGSKCYFQIKKYPSPNNKNPGFEGSLLTNFMTNWQSGGCETKLPKEMQSQNKWQIRAVVVNPNGTKSEVLTDILMNYGAIGSVNIDGIAID